MSFDFFYVCLLCLVILVLFGVVVILVIGKVIVWWLSGLVSLFVGFIDFLLDSVVLLFNLLVVYYLLCLVDDDYCYGYGKVEVLVGLVQVMFIGVSVVLVVIQVVE